MVASTASGGGSSATAALLPSLSASLPGADDLAAPLARYLQGQGLVRALQERPPRAHGKPLDLCKLYREVRRLGGFQRVAAGERWSAVAEALFPSSSGTSSSSSSSQPAKAAGGRGSNGGNLGALSLAVTLSVAYRRFLLGYEAVEEEQLQAEEATQLQASQQSLEGQADDASARGLKRPRPGAALGTRCRRMSR